MSFSLSFVFRIRLQMSKQNKRSTPHKALKLTSETVAALGDASGLCDCWGPCGTMHCDENKAGGAGKEEQGAKNSFRPLKQIQMCGVLIFQ